MPPGTSRRTTTGGTLPAAGTRISFSLFARTCPGAIEHCTRAVLVRYPVAWRGAWGEFHERYPPGAAVAAPGLASGDKNRGVAELPKFFCWSRLGAEAGESVAAIIARKEVARALDDGRFLWGIGQPVDAAIRALIGRVERPEVIFTDMLSSPKPRDANPSSTVLWRAGIGLDGLPTALPLHSLVTSRGDRPKHFALVCHSDEPLDKQLPGPEFRKCDVRNISSGKVPADQQNTTTVRYSPDPGGTGRRYLVRFRAELVHPYLVALRDPVEVPDDVRRSAATANAASALRLLRRLAEA